MTSHNLWINFKSSPAQYVPNLIFKMLPSSPPFHILSFSYAGLFAALFFVHFMFQPSFDCNQDIFSWTPTMCQILFWVLGKVPRSSKRVPIFQEHMTGVARQIWFRVTPPVICFFHWDYSQLLLKSYPFLEVNVKVAPYVNNINCSLSCKLI